MVEEKKSPSTGKILTELTKLRAVKGADLGWSDVWSSAIVQPVFNEVITRIDRLADPRFASSREEIALQITKRIDQVLRDSLPIPRVVDGSRKAIRGKGISCGVWEVDKSRSTRMAIAFLREQGFVAFEELKQARALVLITGREMASGATLLEKLGRSQSKVLATRTLKVACELLAAHTLPTI